MQPVQAELREARRTANNSNLHPGRSISTSHKISQTSTNSNLPVATHEVAHRNDGADARGKGCVFTYDTSCSCRRPSAQQKQTVAPPHHASIIRWRGKTGLQLIMARLSVPCYVARTPPPPAYPAVHFFDNSNACAVSACCSFLPVAWTRQCCYRCKQR